MVMTLAQAASSLGLAPTTLREQIRRGRIAAIKPGHDWLVDEAEVERYRAESKGRAGRPRNLLEPTKSPIEDIIGKPGEPNILAQRPPFEDVTGRPGEPNLLDQPRRSGHRKWSEVKRQKGAG